MSTTSAPAAPTRPQPRPRVSPVKQTLRLTRTEITLFARYKTAWIYALLPLFFLFTAMQLPPDPVVGGFGLGEMTMFGMIGVISLIFGVGHASNVFTARRESLVLKRLRVSGVPPLAIFGGVIGVVFVFSLLLTVFIAGLILAMPEGALPRDPVMLFTSVLLGSIVFSLLGLAVTPLVRNAEMAQMASMVPMMILLFSSGGIMPLEFLPETARTVVGLLPSMPAGELVQAAYTGYDVFGGFAGAEEVGTLGLWTAALPSLAVLGGWIAVLGLVVARCFRWDPRQG
ncbi:ABC transporter permease [Nocardiopsis salina]|uniref:ABC transporter permease n=1 Tax=Nocardiopsis salina TaxID=245836 RepID=UPI00034CD411|nr:ABC transporter permease [Nocardiopsis salina]